MDYSNKDSLKPLLASMGMLGVATITSIAGGPLAAGALGLAGKVVFDLVSNVAPNILSEQITKINPKKLRQYFTSGVPNIANHDLYKGFKNAIKLGLDATVDSYKNSLSKEEDSKHHINAIFKRIELLKKSIDDDFDVAFTSVSDEQINDYVENQTQDLYDRINSFLNIEDLSSHGNRFLPFVKEVLPAQILAAFTEILKRESRVWIAYQRLILTDIQANSKETNSISHELLGKVNTLSVQLEMIQRKMDLDKEKSSPASMEMEQLWALFGEAKSYHEMSINKLNRYHSKLTSKLNDIHIDLKDEIAKAGVERQVIISKTEESIEIVKEIAQISSKQYEEIQEFQKNQVLQNEEQNGLIEILLKEFRTFAKDKNPEVIQETLQNIEASAQKLASIDIENAAYIVKEAMGFLKKGKDIEKALLVLNDVNLEKLKLSALSNEDFRQVIEAYELRIELLKSRFRYAEIDDCYNNIIGIYEQTNPKSNLLALTYHNAGVNLELNGKYSNAFGYHKKGTKIREEILNNNHPDLATSYDNLALAYRAIYKKTEALTYHKKAFEIREKVLTKNHPDLAASYYNIAKVYRVLSKYQDALKYNRRAINIMEKIYDADHLDLAAAYDDFGIVNRFLRNLSEALIFHLKAIKIREKLLVSNHPDLATSYYNIAIAYRVLEYYTDSLNYCKKAIKIREDVLGKKHPKLAASYDTIARTYEELRKKSKVLEYQKKAIEVRKHYLDKTHSDWVIYYSRLAHTYQALGKYSDAMRYKLMSLKVKISI